MTDLEYNYTHSIDAFEYDPINHVATSKFAVVYAGRSKRDPNKKVAVKIFGSKISPDRQQHTINDINILKELSHDNIAKIITFSLVTNKMYLITEFSNGGDLENYLRETGIMVENTVRILLKHMSSALTYLRDMNVVHRDLKPCNILLHYPKRGHTKKMQDLYKYPTGEISFKIVDFGLSKWLDMGGHATTECTPEFYRAPEVFLKCNHDWQVDIWSLGIVTLQCLHGFHPLLKGLDYGSACSNSHFKFPIPTSTSTELKSVIEEMLEHNPTLRITALELGQHEFITGESSVKDYPPPTLSMADEAKQENWRGQRNQMCSRRGEVTLTPDAKVWKEAMEEGWDSPDIILPASMGGLKVLVWMEVDNGQFVVECRMADDEYNSQFQLPQYAHIVLNIKKAQSDETTAGGIVNVEWKELGVGVLIFQCAANKLDKNSPLRFEFTFSCCRSSK